jgi:hypothetical protein
VKITRSKKMERKILDKIKQYLSRAPRSLDKWHVSDLLYPRKSVFARLDPQPMTDLSAMYFIAGRAHHGILEACLGPKKWKDGKRVDAGEYEKDGIYYSPDLRMPYPWEIKTSRKEYDPLPKNELRDYEGYLKQLSQYQACMNDDRGGLLVFYLNMKERGVKWKKPALRFYKVLMTAKERATKLKWMKGMSAKMSAAQKKKSVKDLPLCPSWMCRECPWYKSCKPWLMDEARKGYQK